MKLTSFAKCLLAAAAPALLAGCISLGPDFEAPEWDGPEAWSGDTTSTAVLPDGAPWWSVFNDPVLDALEAELLAQNPSLAAAVARLDASAAALGMARAGLAPSVGLSGSAAYSRQPGEKTDFNPDWYYKPGAALSWEFDFWGRVRRSVEAAAADLSSSEQNLLDARRLLAAQLASSYISLRTAQARLDYARENVELQSDTLELVRSRCEAGLNPDLDLRQAELNLATTRASIPALEAEIDATLNSIAALVGGWPGSQEALRDSAPIPLPDEAALPAALPADVLRNRPDVAAALHAFHASVARIGAAKAEMFPKISINGSFAFSSNDTGELFKQNSQTYAVGPSVEWPIFTAGRLRNQVRSYEAYARAAEADFRTAVLSAAAECETALSSRRAAAAVLGDLHAAVDAATQAVDLVDTLYRNGLTDFQNVLSMQQQLASSQDALAQGIGYAADALVAVWKSFAAPCTPPPATEPAPSESVDPVDSVDSVEAVESSESAAPESPESPAEPATPVEASEPAPVPAAPEAAETAE